MPPPVSSFFAGGFATNALPCARYAVLNVLMADTSAPTAAPPADPTPVTDILPPSSKLTVCVVSELEHWTCACAPEIGPASPMRHDAPPSKAAFLDFITTFPQSRSRRPRKWRPVPLERSRRSRSSYRHRSAVCDRFRLN